MSAPPIVWIRPGLGFEPTAAGSWQRMEKQKGRALDCNSSYRDWDAQYQLWLNYQNGVPGAPYALHPDDSMHCKGLASDSDEAAMIANTMSDYGWRQTALAVGEWWHLDYNPALDKHLNDPAGEGSEPFPTEPSEKDEDEMKPRQIHYTAKDGSTLRALIVPGTGYFVKWTETNATYANAIAAGMETGPSVEVTESLFNVFRDAAKAVRTGAA